MTQSLPAPSGTDVVYAGIRDQILAGQLTPDEVLFEAAVGSQFGVSRTPVREAFTRLVEDGLLVRHKRGYSVVDESLTEVIEIFDMRVILEAAAAGFAARRCSDFDIAGLEQLNHRAATLLANTEGDEPSPEVVDELLSLNRDWHLHLARASGHTYLQRMIETVMARQAMYNVRMRIDRVSGFHSALESHIALIEALKAHDGDLAETMTRDHLKAENARRLAVYVRNSQSPNLPTEVNSDVFSH